MTAGLKSVNLFNNRVGQKQSQKYSGGMKRRLSVAISFMGDPRVVYLVRRAPLFSEEWLEDHSGHLR